MVAGKADKALSNKDTKRLRNTTVTSEEPEQEQVSEGKQGTAHPRVLSAPP